MPLDGARLTTTSKLMAMLGGILGYFECLFSVSKITHEELIPSDLMGFIRMYDGISSGNL